MLDELQIETGRPFVVELEASTGTGYGWVVASASRGLEVVVGAARPTSPGMPGAPALTDVTVTAAEAGEYELLVELRRPWEREAAEECRYTITAV